MIAHELSEQFKALAAKVYTFCFVGLALKFLSVESLNYGGVRLSLQDAKPLLGAIAVVVVVLTIASGLALLRDYIDGRIKDSLLETEQISLEGISFEPGKRGETFLERRYGVVMTLTTVTYFIEGIVPLIVGTATSITMYEEMVSLARAVTN